MKGEPASKDLVELKVIYRNRFGLFNQPLPLTVGDESTHYYKPSKLLDQFLKFIFIAGRERSECGKLKSILNNPARGTKDTFEKDLKSNAIGDEFVDPGQYFLRKPDNNPRLKK